MFYSHQLLARKAPLGQIWMAATMHAKINRKGLNKLNMNKIGKEILNPSVPMAFRLSGILMDNAVNSKGVSFYSHVASGGRIPSSMRGAVFWEKGKPLSIEEFHIPRPETGEVLIRTKACGVCRSDLYVMKGEVPFSNPCVLGHEITGEVVQHGPLTDHKIKQRLPVGSRVVGSYIITHGSCCYSSKGQGVILKKILASVLAKGLLHDGKTRLFLRSSGKPISMYCMGGLAEYCVVPATALAVLPDSLPYTESAILGCAVLTAYGAMAHADGVRRGDSVAVIGTGGVGSSCVQIARALGASAIIAVDIQDDKLEKAKIFGATHTVNITREDPIEKIIEITGGKGVDVAVEALGTPQAFYQCIQIVKVGGKIAMIGPVQYTALGRADEKCFFRKKIQVIGLRVNIGRQNFSALVKLAETGIFNLSNIVSRRYKFEEADKAFANLDQRKIIGRAVIEIR